MRRSDGEPCTYPGGTTATINTHIKSVHRGDPSRPNFDMLKDYCCDYQSLFTGKLKHYFRVQTGLTRLESHPDGAKNPYSVFMQQISSVKSSSSHPEPMRHKELPSFLRKTRWNIFLEPYRNNPNDVVSLVQYPTVKVSKAAGKDGVFERVLAKLPDVCLAWMEKVYGYWESSSDYAQQMFAKYPM